MGEDQRGREQIHKEIEFNQKEIKKIEKEQITYTIIQFIISTCMGYLAISNILEKDYVFSFIDFITIYATTYTFMNCIRSGARLQMSLESFIKMLHADLEIMDITEDLEN